MKKARASDGVPPGTPADPPDLPARVSRPITAPAIVRRTLTRIATAIAADLEAEPLELRAAAYHYEMIGCGCECFEAGRYPCKDCQAETLELLALLRSVADDAIAATVQAMQRLDTEQLPIGRRRVDES